MSEYKVKSNIKHDETHYKKGDTIELESEAAKVLLRDGIIVDPNASEEEDEESETPQPAVNNVEREGDDVEGEAKVTPGTGEKPQPGDGADTIEGDEPKTSQYKVIKSVEIKGVVHEVDSTLDLTEDQASKFPEGLIEKVGDNL